MILSGPVLSTLQRCPRRYRLETGYRVLRVRPKELFKKLLRQAVFEMSAGADHTKVAAEATTRFLETAARPGLDILGDPYTLSRDFCAMLETVLEAISRLVLLTLKPGPLVKIADDRCWQIVAFLDDTGILHRWTALERWDDDARYRELHSHHVFGDCAAAQSGMWLHVVEIGRLNRGHQHSPWCRIFKHPAILGHNRFRKLDGTPLEPSWKPVWYQDSDRNDPKTWVDAMEADRVDPIHHLQIREPDPQHVEEFRRDVVGESARALALPSDWQQIPRFRPACDLPPCPWQNACFAPPSLVNIEGIGGYAKIEKKGDSGR